MSVFGLQRLVDFIAQAVEDFAGGARNIDFFQVSRPWQVHNELAFDAARTEGEQNNAITQSDGFTHIVGNKNNRAPSFRPNALQFVMPQVSRLGIKGGKGLVQEKD